MQYMIGGAHPLTPLWFLFANILRRPPLSKCHPKNSHWPWFVGTLWQVHGVVTTGLLIACLANFLCEELANLLWKVALGSEMQCLIIGWYISKNQTFDIKYLNIKVGKWFWDIWFWMYRLYRWAMNILQPQVQDEFAYINVHASLSFTSWHNMFLWHDSASMFRNVFVQKWQSVILTWISRNFRVLAILGPLFLAI